MVTAEMYTEFSKMDAMRTQTVEMLSHLPDEDVVLVNALIKKLIHVWNSDFTNVTERKKRIIEKSDCEMKAGCFCTEEEAWTDTRDIHIGKQVVAVRIIKEKIKANYKSVFKQGPVAIIGTDNIVAWTGLSADEVSGLVELCLKFEPMEMAKVCADMYPGDWSIDDRCWFQQIVYEMRRDILNSKVFKDEFDFQTRINDIEFVFDVRKVCLEAKSEKTIRRLLVSYREYVEKLIQAALEKYDREVVHEMGCFGELLHIV